MHPLPAKIVEYRQYTKLKSTYVDALPQMVNPKTGRVRLVPSGGRGHRATQFQRPEPAKHPRPHPRRPGNPFGLHSG